ncbi:synaptonemal complex protein 1 [Candidatus Neoehrlichia procyonis]|uniref:Putative membrane protein n=1 Tax=Candidatus Neoehrlichia procyonis str. RAC413 TaxID=1359163 RepID=A0A0F3NPL2_9RICK|nr:hypothetical protein [Candidatus Neoehrlichia lotoris]KJV69617.1 putative membrane protein [Candidatus Neoehrlichia lotoris str. RAC413]
MMESPNSVSHEYVNNLQESLLNSNNSLSQINHDTLIADIQQLQNDYATTIEDINKINTSYVSAIETIKQHKVAKTIMDNHTETYNNLQKYLDVSTKLNHIHNSLREVQANHRKQFLAFTSPHDAIPLYEAINIALNTATKNYNAAQKKLKNAQKECSNNKTIINNIKLRFYTHQQDLACICKELQNVLINTHNINNKKIFTIEQYIINQKSATFEEIEKVQEKLKAAIEELTGLTESSVEKIQEIQEELKIFIKELAAIKETTIQKELENSKEFPTTDIPTRTKYATKNTDKKLAEILKACQNIRSIQEKIITLTQKFIDIETQQCNNNMQSKMLKDSIQKIDEEIKSTDKNLRILTVVIEQEERKKILIQDNINTITTNFNNEIQKMQECSNNVTLIHNKVSSIQREKSDYENKISQLYNDFIATKNNVVNKLADITQNYDSQNYDTIATNLQKDILYTLSIVQQLINKEVKTIISTYDPYTTFYNMAPEMLTAVRLVKEYREARHAIMNKYLTAKRRIEQKYNINVNYLIKNNNNNNASYVDRLFFAVTLLIIIVDAASSAFSLAAKFYNLEIYKQYVTYIVYSLSIILSLFLILQSVIALKQTNKDKKENIITSNLAKIQHFQSSLSIVSSILWTTLFAISLYMLTGNYTKTLVNISLVLSLVAPIIGFISSISRVSDQWIQQKNKQHSPQERHRSILNLILRPITLYVIISTLELIHCVCHILEAINLKGNMQNIYNFNILPAIIVQLIVAIMFMALEILQETNIWLNINNNNNKTLPDDLSHLINNDNSLSDYIVAYSAENAAYITDENNSVYPQVSNAMPTSTSMHL